MYRPMLLLLTSSMLILGAEGTKSVVNDVVDILLDSAIQDIKENGRDRIRIPGMRRPINLEVFGNILARGSFLATRGTLRDMSTIRRTGDVTIEIEGSTVILTANMGFGLVAIDYRRYTLDLGRLQSTGAIHAESTNNSMIAALSVYRPPGDTANCTVRLLNAEITDVGTIDVEMIGPGDLNMLGSLVIPWVMNRFSFLIRDQFNLHVKELLIEALKNKQDYICEQFPF